MDDSADKASDGLVELLVVMIEGAKPLAIAAMARIEAILRFIIMVGCVVRLLS
mgnify:CR=1 FL=1